MKFILYSVLLLLPFSSCPGQENDSKEEVIIKRIDYLYDQRDVINDNIWHGISEPNFDLPLIYYTENACYIANPTEKIITLFHAKLRFQNEDMSIYKTSLIDKSPFHMETSIDFGDDTTAYNFQNPVMNCSSVEITNQTIPEVNTTELWSTMVLHEYFHGFQFKHAPYQAHIKNIIANFPQDSIRKIYTSNDWFKAYVDEENRLLLSAIASDNPEETIQLVDSFLSSRDKRRKETIRVLNIDITEIENIYETMEGSARYVEFNLYKLYANSDSMSRAIHSDPSFQDYIYFKEFDLKNERWLYSTEYTAYYYATGFNMIRLLDKLNIEYKSRLFKEESLTLGDILREYRMHNR